MIDLDLVQVRDNLTYDGIPLKTNDQRVKQLRGKIIPLVKVISSTTNEGDATWEL